MKKIKAQFPNAEVGKAYIESSQRMRWVVWTDKSSWAQIMAVGTTKKDAIERAERNVKFFID